jgi:hypothetical protein
MTKRSFAFALIFLLSGAGVAHADGFLCPRTGRLVSIGDTAAEVVTKCGTPTMDQGRTWLYDFGRTSFTRILHFKRGVLKCVDLGDYGAADS